jgi:hypothetical protein
MRIWDKLFGKKTKSVPDKSPYLPSEEIPVDIKFAETFTNKGGHFLFCESVEQISLNIDAICLENHWEKEHILSLNETVADQFKLTPIRKTSGDLKVYQAAVIYCEYMISNTGKFLLSEHQIKHFNLTDLPKTVIIIAKTNQIVRDVSQGMSSIKNKYKKTIPTNITSLEPKTEDCVEKAFSESETSAKNIYLLLED